MIKRFAVLAVLILGGVLAACTQDDDDTVRARQPVPVSVPASGASAVGASAPASGAVG